MKYVLVLAFALVAGLASALPQKYQPLSDEHIARINAKQSSWKAGRNFEVEDYELFKVMASGVKKSSEDLKSYNKMVHDDDEDVPDYFDAREAWPECADVIGLIRDQSRCGSCWAFAAAEAMSDRICIHSNGTRKMLVSAQDLITCGTGGGCHGGFPIRAWEDWFLTGVVTGGLYNTTSQGCKSYFLPNCDDHPNQCIPYVDTPDCVMRCDDSSLNYDDQKTYGYQHYDISGEKQIQLEILKNGPVEAIYFVYTDFANYKSGIYQVTDEGVYEGTHAVKILGWGEENGIKYWLIANSWNERWGENGFFRMIRGQNEAYIEEMVVVGLPDFSKF